jgi:Icc-related predicted phosphoesterase
MTSHFPRVRDIDSGKVMVVTDLHGDYDAYTRYRDRFLTLRERGDANVLVFCGDLIHAEPSAPDRSLDIVRDVIALKDKLGHDLIYLLGNHELPHLYHTALARGDHVYTIAFEHRLGAHRAEVIALLDGLPFYVRTRAGVALSHAGAAEEIATPKKMAALFNYSHAAAFAKADRAIGGASRESLQRAIEKMSGEPYADMAREYLAVAGPDDARYGDLLRGALATMFHDDYGLLYAALFTRNEYQYGAANYPTILDHFLKALSQGYEEQHVLVTGHIVVNGGHTLVANRQLRLASAAHAHPREAGLYLLFDASRPIVDVKDLRNGLRSVFK